MPKVIKYQGADMEEGLVHIPDHTPKPDGAVADDLVPDEIPPPEERLQEALEAFEGQRQQLFEQARAEAEAQAQEVSHRILQNARNEREKLLEEARSEAGGIRQTARQEAYEQAIAEKREEIAAHLEQVNVLMQELREDQQQFLQQYEDGLFQLASDIAEKVLRASVSSNADLLRPLVKDAVLSVKNADWISVQISDQLPSLVEKLREDLSGHPSLRREVGIEMADLPPDSCIVYTPDGVVDASVSAQLTNLRSLVRSTDEDMEEEDYQ